MFFILLGTDCAESTDRLKRDRENPCNPVSYTHLDVYKRQADDYPFTVANVPLEVKAVGRLVPEWEIDETGLCGVLPEEDAARGDKEEITLIPMGAARLRISAFPNTRE